CAAACYNHPSNCGPSTPRNPPAAPPKPSAPPRNITHRSQNLRRPIYTGFRTPPFNMVRVIRNSDAEVTGNFNTVTVISNSDAEVTGNRNMVTALCGGSAEVSNQNDQVVLKAPCLGR